MWNENLEGARDGGGGRCGGRVIKVHNQPAACADEWNLLKLFT